MEINEEPVLLLETSTKEHGSRVIHLLKLESNLFSKATKKKNFITSQRYNWTDVQFTFISI